MDSSLDRLMYSLGLVFFCLGDGDLWAREVGRVDEVGRLILAEYVCLLFLFGDIISSFKFILLLLLLSHFLYRA